jgi:acetyl esterase/lipase
MHDTLHAGWLGVAIALTIQTQGVCISSTGAGCERPMRRCPRSSSGTSGAVSPTAPRRVLERHRKQPKPRSIANSGDSSLSRGHRVGGLVNERSGLAALGKRLYAPVDDDTPPTFLLRAQDDPVDPVENSLAYYAALRKAGVPAEMPVFVKGGHAFGLRPTDAPITRWPPLVETWLRTIGVIPR